MNTGMKLTGAAVAACAACCAVSVVPLMLASVGTVLVGSALVKWGAIAVLLIVPVVGLLLLSRRKAAPQAVENHMPTNSCGCGSCGTDVKQEAPIACTLDANEFKARTELIHKLTSRHLRQATRTALRLNLTYAPEALSEVRELVRKEQACCAFLTFDLRHDATGVFVTIIAPQAAAAAAGDLFAHLAPAALTMETSA
ncbi:hypothetical protein FHX14_005418 [Rhizobium sp. BK619]|uniref:hypothetical protein n=1 Tax=Rhizobium sp. BK619 TaxID=2586989 RepID=UPI001618F53F|nr:hypothetical protein [Rhizobium sp. BK619]MBB3649184.1 hypothetical protein [Rhizobium sp. BK619]